MRTIGSPQVLEARRRRAIGLLQSGLSIQETAERVDASFVSVFRWQQNYLKKGDRSLTARPVSGRPRKLTRAQAGRLVRVLLKGAVQSGFPNELWTLGRIAVVIRRQFGVEYHPNHVWRILREAGWSCQVPERRAIQRDEEAIAYWKRYTWPAIKKSPKTWGPSGLSR